MELETCSRGIREGQQWVLAVLCQEEMQKGNGEQTQAPFLNIWGRHPFLRFSRNEFGTLSHEKDRATIRTGLSRTRSVDTDCHPRITLNDWWPLHLHKCRGICMISHMVTLVRKNPVRVPIVQTHTQFRYTVYSLCLNLFNCKLGIIISLS